MARDTSLYLRKATIRHLRGDASLTALVPAPRVFGLHVDPDPVKPFIRYGVPTALPDRASCVDGARVLMTLHCFSDQKSEDQAARIAETIAASLDGATLQLIDAPYEAVARIVWTGSQIVPDPEETSAWHGVVNFEAVVVS